MTDALNPEPLLRALHDAGVRHIIIGGFAVIAHGVIRPSRDLDIVPDPDPDNLGRLAQLLADLNARHVGLGDFEPDEFPFDPTRAEDLEGGASSRKSRVRRKRHVPTACDGDLPAPCCSTSARRPPFCCALVIVRSGRDWLRSGLEDDRAYDAPCSA